MKKIDINSFSTRANQLYQQIIDLSDKEIEIEVDNEKTDSFLNLNQSQHSVSGEVITIQITNSPNIEYMLIHELLHIKLDFGDYSKMEFNLFSSDASFNQQAQTTAMALKEVIDHRLISEWEQAEKVRDEEIQDSLNQGTSELLAADGQAVDDEKLILYRTLIMLDNQYFDQKYPQAYELAQTINESISEVTNKTQYHSALVQLFKDFDESIQKYGYIDLLHNQFVTVTPVLSQRQLRLAVNQIFELVHTEFVNQKNQRPYILETKSNLQNSGVIEFTQQETTPEFFQNTYQMKVADLLDKYQIDYIIR
ncbi:hypothetical protein Q2T76_01005 [Lactobacillus sp. YT155]|uniref:hypothetical protein n=1 Tax=Lactobacillus sp. YT155 TaxID=3060955 RepID=UPI00265F0671|nr:hypothetical protein [Lactobacillus sp. YT155]MDO1604628.1 hypothetical protein [Lactobacillus sp. YT155]